MHFLPHLVSEKHWVKQVRQEKPDKEYYKEAVFPKS